jgi:type IV pilus assembly protein PilQ
MVDKRTNALIISDIPKKLQPLDQLISTLDSETPQVMIEARIVETSKSFSQDLGIKWGFNAIADASKGTGTGLVFPANASAKYGLNLPGAGTASTLAFSFGNILDSFTLDIALSDLETEGRGRILSSPKIATQNNERAEIEQGVRIPVVTTTATEISVQFVSASLRLAVTPQITADGTVAMDVTVENNSPDFVNRVGDVPPIRTQRAQTKILVADGGTAVIGGIFTINEGQSEVGVPWFRKIPGLGWLFKTRNITNENRELLIFITPKIVKIG